LSNRKLSSLPGVKTESGIDPLISLRGVKKVYKNAAGDFPALRGIDLDIQPGEFVGILGKSGAGKTTLANLITAVDHVSEGEINIGGVDVHSLNENQAAAWRGRNLVSFIKHSTLFHPSISLKMSCSPWISAGCVSPNSKQSDLENKYNTVKSDTDLAKARLDEARRTSENRKDGPDQDQLALAQARLDAANAQLLAATTALGNLDIVAPYDGTVAKVDVSAGEEVSPAQPVITFADLSQWFVETTDLTENEVVNIKNNMDVIVIPDTLPNLQLKGQIDSISDFYTEKAGDITYRVRVKLADTDPRLRWGMTTETRFSESTK
jgi:ABC-type lipoprotein export system ATPase subunit